MYLVVTVDTEADDQWGKGDTPTLENIKALPRFQQLCETFGMKPTYLITFEVAHDPFASSLLRGWQERGGAEIGAHLHPWTTPPLKKGEGLERAFPNELSDEALRDKLALLTDEIEKMIGTRPTSYRAGRWGFDARQAALLGELGYLIDSSVTPGISWRESKGAAEGRGGPDFTRESAHTHRLDNAVLEVPMTILRAGLLRRRRWLRIFENTTDWKLRMVVRAAMRQKLPAIVFMIHSSELMVGKSPYVKTEAQLENVYARLEHLFAYCKQQGIAGVTMTQFAKEYADRKV